MELSSEQIFDEIADYISDKNIDAIKKSYSSEKDIHNDFFNIAIESQNKEIIDFFYDTGNYNFQSNHMMYLAQFGNLELMKYIYAKKCPMDNETTTEASRKGQLECLKWAIDNGCPYDYALRNAAHTGKLDCIKYLVEEKKEYADLITVELAAESGSLECIKYLHSINAPFRKSVLKQAKLCRKKTRNTIIKYLIDNIGL